MLKRWQASLTSQDFKAIYLNAWEDDFCDDPLLALLGQMSDHFKKGTLKELADKVARVALPLLKENLLSVIKSQPGLTFTVERPERDLLEEYRYQSATKDKLKSNLTELSKAVFAETQHPLVFIIDELDRCRPTFAIELLERVKHIFDVPHMVFILGLNRDELANSLTSVYGDIDSDVYLRRFFDFEFQLPTVGSRIFARHLLEKYQLQQVFKHLSDEFRHAMHMFDYDNFASIIPEFWAALGLSLRDIDYGIRLLSLLASSVPLGGFSHPYLLSLLIPMKFKNLDLYREMIAGEVRAQRIMDYVSGQLRYEPTNVLSHHLDRIEGFLYCADDDHIRQRERGAAAREELTKLMPSDRPGSEASVLSRRAWSAEKHQRDRILAAIHDGWGLQISGNVFGHLARLIDTHQMELRR